MKIASTYDEWKAAVYAEADKLRAVRLYLNGIGRKRMDDMAFLGNLSEFCGSAAELAEWIDSKDGMDREDLERLESDHLRLTISRLRKIAAKETRDQE